MGEPERSTTLLDQECKIAPWTKKNPAISQMEGFFLRHLSRLPVSADRSLASVVVTAVYDYYIACN